MKKTCKLYRDIIDILNPSISRKNISDYKIIIRDDLLQVQIYYPSINTTLDKVSIYIHGREICNDFYKEYALKTNSIVFLIDYKKENYIENLDDTISFIIKELLNNNVSSNNIKVVGDFLGADIILELISKSKKDIYNKIDKLLISPTSEDLSKITDSNILVLSNNEKQKFSNKTNNILLKESLYDLIHDIDIVTNEKIYKYILDFLER